MKFLASLAIVMLALPVQAASIQFAVTIDAVDDTQITVFDPGVDASALVGQSGTLSITIDENNLDVLPNQNGSLLRLGVPELEDQFGNTFGDFRLGLEVGGARGALGGNLDGLDGVPVATFEFFPGDRLVITEDDFDGGLRLDVAGVPLTSSNPFLTGLDTSLAFGSFRLFDQGGIGLNGTVTPQPVPEPSSIALLGIGGLIVGAAVRRRKS